MHNPRFRHPRPFVALAAALLLGAVPLEAPPPAEASVGAGSPVAQRQQGSRVVRKRLVARPARQDLDGDGALEHVWTFNGTTPGPEIRARVGDTVAVRFTNRLPVPTTVHWHGIELDNRSDGSPVTQNEVPPGGRYRYRFKVTRPGTFWYHPHIKPSNQVFRGLYGPLIVTDESDEELTRMGVLPERQEVLVLSDVTVCKEPGRNDEATFPADASLPWSGPGDFPGDRLDPTPRDLCETPLNDAGRRTGQPLPAGSIPNVLPERNCEITDVPCRVSMGQWVLTNGAVAAARAGSPERPGELAPGARPLRVRSGEGVRLRLINAAIFRYFRLVLTDADGRRRRIYRVGGEGGLLNRVRVEGGRRQGFDSGYRRGEIVLAPGDRADVVIVPSGSDGDVLTLWTQGYAHTGRGVAAVPTVPVRHFEISGGLAARRAFKIRPRKRLLADRRIGRPHERLESATATLLDPRDLEGGPAGSADPVIRLTSPGPSVDGVTGRFERGAHADFRDIPHLKSSRWARTGDLLELRVSNQTGAHHGFHLHGFSFQPLRLEGFDGTRYTFRAPEFMDTVDIPSGMTLVFRVRLADRSTARGAPAGGALGRWLLHCHILHHAALGMMAELVVLPPEQDR